MGVGVALGRDVHVVEMGRVLGAEKETKIAVTVIASRLLHFHVHRETAEFLILEQRDAEWRPDRRLVLALLEELEVFAVLVRKPPAPRGWIRESESAQGFAIRESDFPKQFLSLRGDRCLHLGLLGLRGDRGDQQGDGDGAQEW